MAQNFGVVAITGVGVVAPGSKSSQELWRRTQAGLTGAKLPSCEGWPAVCPVEEGLEIPGGLELRRSHRLDRATRMLVVAVARACEDAGLSEHLPGERLEVGVVVGTSRGAVSKWRELFCGGRRGARPSLALDTTPACLHGSVVSYLGLSGPALTLSTACASGAHAVAVGAQQILCGGCDVVLACGCDAPLVEELAENFRLAGMLTEARPPDAVCRPFDRGADGTVLGEGAGCLVLERADVAKRRGARMLGVLAGWGLASEGRFVSAAATGGKSLARAVGRALDMACLMPGDIGYVNAHGTGTRLNDEMEVGWLREFERLRGAAVPFGSTKAVTGHCLGATPIFEAAICLEALRRGELPRSVNCFEPREGAEGGIILESGRRLERLCVMSNSMGFWGSAAALIFGRAGE